MVNHFDMAREMWRLVDAGRSAEELANEVVRRFPEARSADIKRAADIAIERLEILEEERQETARAFVEKWYTGREAEKFFGSTPAQEVVDNAAMFYLMDYPLKPSAETLFPKPDKSKS
jgi:hypothetical protein